MTLHLSSKSASARGLMALIAGGALSLFLLTGCFQTDADDSPVKSAQVKNDSGKPKDDATTIVNPEDTVPWVCGTPDPDSGIVPVEIPDVEDPKDPDVTPVDDGDFAPIDWSAKAIAGSEGWHCSVYSQPVCAGNGKTYRNICEAAWSGQLEKSAGRCP
jgi:hypothetical protein